MKFFSAAVLLSMFAGSSASLPPTQQVLENGAAAPQKPLDIPLLGFGTWNLKTDNHNASKAVSYAIEAGFRHIDCAAAYHNEKDVGKGIAEGLENAGLKREQIWVTSKLWNTEHKPAQVEVAFNKTLSDLRLEYLDLYLMHWPVSNINGKNDIYFIPTWEAMVGLLKTGKVRHIGVSNFAPAQLSRLLASSPTVPYAHQMELHPYLPQTAWLFYHAAHGIRVTAYSPLGNANPTYGPPQRGDPPKLLENDVVREITAARRGCTPATVALAWGMGRGTSVIPKSQHAAYIKENAAAPECELEHVDWKALEALGRASVRFNNPSESWGVPLYEGLDGVYPS